jgi:hypothetical protein
MRIINTRKGYVSPQYHILHDDSFATVVSAGVLWPHFTPLQWNTLLQTGYKQYLDPDFDRFGELFQAPPLTDEWLMGPECVLRAGTIITA